jgi:flagellar biosynthesis GTPase FlhF
LLNLQQGKKVLEDETKMLRGSLETAKYERDKAEAKVRTAKATSSEETQELMARAEAEAAQREQEAAKLRKELSQQAAEKAVVESALNQVCIGRRVTHFMYATMGGMMTDGLCVCVICRRRLR